jgi:hypothetical protein
MIWSAAVAAPTIRIAIRDPFQLMSAPINVVAWYSKITWLRVIIDDAVANYGRASGANAQVNAR